MSEGVEVRRMLLFGRVGGKLKFPCRVTEGPGRDIGPEVVTERCCVRLEGGIYDGDDG
jgi:hypothetical protein